MMTDQEFKDNLSQFNGSENLYKYTLGTKITEGVKYACETAACFWFADIIVSYQQDERIRDQKFQTWTLTVLDEKGQVVATDGNKNELISQEISYTHFPYLELKFWCVDRVMLLPSEY